MTPEEKERFKRQMMHDGFDESRQQKLRDATVLLAGIGGLGGEIAYGLVAAGIGRLILVHSGPLTQSNLNRQTLMSEDSIGLSRVETAAARLREFSSFTEVVAHDIAIEELTFLPLLDGVDLVIDARHNFPERKTLNRCAVKERIPFLFAAMDDLDCQMALFRPPVTGCLQCLYPDDPDDWDPFGFAVFGGVAHAVGALAVMEAVKYLSGWGRLADRLVTMDLQNYRMQNFRLGRVKDCPVCADWT